MKKIHEVNEDIRKIAQCWHLRGDTGVKNVLVLEYGTFYNHIIWTNAHHLGMNVSHPFESNFQTEGPTFLFDRLKDAGEWPPSIAMVFVLIRSC